MELVVVLGVCVILCGVMLSLVLWGRRDAPAPLRQQFAFPRKGSIAWGWVFSLLLEPGSCLSQT